MTIFQIISSAVALLLTIYCVPMRRGERFSALGAVFWVASLVVVVVAFVGVQS